LLFYIYLITFKFIYCLACM